MLKNFDTTASPVLRDRVFRLLRQRMLRQCVDCDGASSITELTDFLEVERALGKASPLPTWFRFQRPNYRLGALGLRRCCAFGCSRVESEQLKMKKCSKCVARYCSASCQTTDWKDRHKAMCATVMKTLKDSARTAGAGDEGLEGAPGVGPEVVWVGGGSGAGSRGGGPDTHSYGSLSSLISAGDLQAASEAASGMSSAQYDDPPMPEDIGSMTFAEMTQRLLATPSMTARTANAMANAPPDMREIIAEGIPPEVLFNIMGLGNGGMPEINFDLMQQFIASQIASVRGGTESEPGRGNGSRGGSGADSGSAEGIQDID